MHQSVSLVTIDENQAGQRLDNFLLKILKGVPKSHVYRIVRKGEVRVNKKRCQVKQKLVIGDVVRVPPVRISQTFRQTPSAAQQAFLLEQILHEDEHLLILNKPAGWAVHGGSGNEFGVIETLKLAKSHTPFIELVHRLDKSTSGCLMVAKSRAALTKLQSLLRTHDESISKTYLALVKGQWQAGYQRINDSLSVVKNDQAHKQTQISSEGKLAESQFMPSQIFTNCSLMKVKIVTGRMHQIRVHAAGLDHPVIGDVKYGDFEFNRSFKRSYGLDRMFLHASKLAVRHPISKQSLKFFAPLSEDLKQVLTALQHESD